MLYHPTNVVHFQPDPKKIDFEDVRFTTRDGLELHAWHFKAKNPKAMVLFFHGNAQNLSSHFMSLYWMVEQSYDLFIFDYRGYGKSEGKPSPEGTVIDGLAALEKISQINQARKEPLPLIVFGHSLGGIVSMQTLIEDQKKHKVDLAVVGSTFHSYQKIGNAVASSSWLLWPFQWLAYIVLSDEWAPNKRIKQISPIPMIVFHGRDDEIIPFKFGEKIFNYAKEPKVFLKLENTHHNDVFFVNKGENRKILLKEIEKILN